MLILIIGFYPKSATTISKRMIMGAPASTVYYKLKLRHPTLDMPIIDYDYKPASFTNQVIAQLELWNEKGTVKYKNDVYVLPRNLDEKVTALHLGRLGGKLSKDNALHTRSVGKQYGGSCRVANEHVVTSAGK